MDGLNGRRPERNAGKGADVNDSFEAIADALMRAGTVLIFTHQNMDGDAVGSSAAMCHVLRQAGKQAWILFNDDEIAENIAFLAEGYGETDAGKLPDPDVSLALDASETSRFPRCAEKFSRGRVRIAVDHHLVDSQPLDLQHIDPGAGATGELVYQLIRAMGQPVDRETAACLFAAITTDTGNFQYSNTTAQTMRIAADLLETGFDAASVSSRLYDSEKPEKVRMHAFVLKDYERFADGKLAMARLSQETLRESGALLSDSEGIVAALRSIRGVGIAAFLKQGENGDIFVSLRSKDRANVERIASGFGGGGHRKAAGCTLHGLSLDEAYARVRDAAVRELEAEAAGETEKG